MVGSGLATVPTVGRPNVGLQSTKRPGGALRPRAFACLATKLKGE